MKKCVRFVTNVLYYELENDAWLAVRPSGTEPKIKFYYGIKGSSYDEAQKMSAEAGEGLPLHKP